MLGSKNDFFKQKPEVLKKCRLDVVSILKIKNRSYKAIGEYLEAFDYFVANPSDFDGATIVKDLLDIRVNSEYLDLDAMLHDFEYITGANKSFIKKWRSDVKYIKYMEKNGKGIRIPRFLVLTLIGIVFVPYKNIVN